MSVVFVIFSFVLICMILVHINFHQKKKELYDFIETVNLTLLKRHNKIAKLLSLLEENDLTIKIKENNIKIVEQLQKNELKLSQAVRAEILLEADMEKLLKLLEDCNLSDEVLAAIESYNKTQKKIEKNKKKYNEIMEKFMEAYNIKPANIYAAFENVDTDFPSLSTVTK